MGRPDIAEFTVLCESYGDDRFDFRPFGQHRQLKLELQYALQCRHDERQVKTHSGIARPVIALAAASGVASLLDWPMQRWVEYFDANHAARHGQNGQLAFLRYAYRCVEDLHCGSGWEAEFPRDIWELHRLGIEGRKRLRFDGIPQPWLRQLTKRFARWRLSIGRSPIQTYIDVQAVTRLAQFLASPQVGVTSVAGLDRAILERYLADLATDTRALRTWTSYAALAGLHDYLLLDRAATVAGSSWRPPNRWGEPLAVTDPDARGGRINGIRRSWDSLSPAERRRLVAPDGGSCLVAVKNGGGPFTAWGMLFERTSDRIRVRFEPRFPHVNPHRLRHTFSMRMLEYLVTGHYRQAARLVVDTDADAALAFYLSKADPLLILRDLLGHSTVLTTEKCLRRLDTTRVYRQAYEGAGAAAGLVDDAGAEREAAAEFPPDARDGGV